MSTNRSPAQAADPVAILEFKARKIQPASPARIAELRDRALAELLVTLDDSPDLPIRDAIARVASAWARQAAARGWDPKTSHALGVFVVQTCADKMDEFAATLPKLEVVR